jgi:hypothetical protein
MRFARTPWNQPVAPRSTERRKERSHAAGSPHISGFGTRRPAVRTAQRLGRQRPLAYGLIGAGGRGRYLNGNFRKLGAFP